MTIIRPTEPAPATESGPAPKLAAAKPAADGPVKVSARPAGPDTLRIRPWVDPLVEALGYDARSDYVEQFWLPALGPSTVLLLRYMARAFEDQSEGFDCTTRQLGWALGLGRNGRSKTLVRCLRRAVDFGMIRLDPTGALLVRRHLPPLPQRQISQLPAGLQFAHRAWIERQSRPPMPTSQPRRPAAGTV
ncbi:MAG TPA: hypothetical protein VMU63_03000 [Acidimicrobiales bacterium]|nr:hypothetical protein [Acidimicrobiales bacterium]